ncbi:hypothetical protein [Phaeobacter piscinae]|uniref:hypothetical protein n=1 Tax=Phaeobacter piscinae TaxID=1580596 RepID=UPI00058DAA74|nr:hypothetical protein [Phaeobacter piscinae]UTS79255.1 hypothetical protein OL67_000301 [Phaeobacter piscinae]
MTSPQPDIEIRAELVRLIEGLDYFRTWRIAQLEATLPAGETLDLNTVVVPGSFFLDLYDQQSRKSDRKQILKEVQSWYAHTANEFHAFMKSGEQEVVQDINAFLARFHADIGFDFFSESGLIRKTMNKAVKRGKLANDAEWYVLQEIMVGGTAGDFTSEEIAQIQLLMTVYEGSR